MNDETILGACLITKGTNSEQAQGLAEGMGHRLCTDMGAFVLTPDELADLLNENLKHITEQLHSAIITVHVTGVKAPIDVTVYGNQRDVARLHALLSAKAKADSLLQWIFKQDRLRIERWMHPGRVESVDVYTALDDDDKPSGRAPTTLEALQASKRAQG